ncbi:MAG: hypothetical protein A2Z29_09825 [Chloroflexi bacterium RBG_16_56_11]|nr:MAG: hypothetical protein A2Z29_09825 [Chloroflexi bacterium RBG_16_56_11]
MWEAYGLKNQDLLWASQAFQGGIAGQQSATCGAVASAAVCLGLRHRYPSSGEKAEKERQAVYKEAKKLVGDFIEKYGAVTCIGLLGIDLSDEEARKKARDEGLFERKCQQYLLFVIDKLYGLEERRRSPEKAG